MTDQELESLQPGDKIQSLDDPKKIYQVDEVGGSMIHITLVADPAFKGYAPKTDVLKKAKIFLQPREVPTKELTCECGIDKLGYGKHSDYCPKYERKSHESHDEGY